MTTLPAKILSLARAGNPVRAWHLFGELGLGDVADDAEVLTLKGRLLKDLAWRARGEERARLFAEASQAYLATHSLRADSYPLINAAALALFAGDDEKSCELATQVLRLIDSNPAEGETPYWREATRAEAQLLLGDTEGAQSSLQTGIAKLPQAWEDHARTIEQFSEIIAVQGGDPAWLDKHSPPCSIHFSGLIGLDPEAPGLVSAIDEVFSQLRPGFAFGALAAGADILIAEAAVHAGAQLHVVLPNSVEQFRDTSVVKFGSEWVTRYDALIDKAERIECLPLLEGGDALTAHSIDTATLVAMGEAVRNAEVLSSRAHALTIAAPGEGDRMHIELWRNAGREVHRIETGRVTDGVRSPGTALGISSPQDCMGLLQIKAIEPALAEATGLESGLKTIQGLTGPVFLGSLAACASTIAKTNAANQTASVALYIGCMGSDGPEQHILDRLTHIVAAAESAQTVLDYSSAMIARALLPKFRLEEVGELASLSGPISLWSLAP